MMKILALATVLIGVTALNTACGSGSAGSSSLPSSSPGGGGGSGNVGTVSPSGFWIDVAGRNGLFDVVMSKDEDFGEECEISSSVTISSGPSKCIIDVLEFDSYAQDVNIQYNVPQNMCEYVLVTPSWHWNYSVGYGPGAVSIVKDADGDITSCQVDTDDTAGETWVDCTLADELHALTDTGSLICEYDYSTRVDGGVNCCFGTYQKHVVDDGQYTVETVKWGGNPGDCSGGAHRTNGWETNKDGIPNTIYQYVKDTGLNDVIEIPANGKNMTSSFQYGVNWYVGLDTGSNTIHSHTGYVSATTSTLPYAYDPIDDLNGTSMRSGYQPNIPYTVTCMSRGAEVKHQWQIYLREWNTYVDWLLYIASSGSTFDPDEDGTEGTDCEWESNFGGPCNDLADVDDIVREATGGVYDTSTVNPTERQSWFPQVDY